MCLIGPEQKATVHVTCTSHTMDFVFCMTCCRFDMLSSMVLDYNTNSLAFPIFS